MNYAIVLGTLLVGGYAGYTMGEQTRWALALALLAANYAYVVIRLLR